MLKESKTYASQTLMGGLSGFESPIGLNLLHCIKCYTYNDEKSRTTKVYALDAGYTTEEIRYNSMAGSYAAIEASGHGRGSGTVRSGRRALRRPARFPFEGVAGDMRGTDIHSLEKLNV